MKISFDGIGERAMTFISDGVKAGDAVKVTGAGTVSPCLAGEGFDGFATGTRGEYAAVVIGGAVTAGYSGTAPGFGRAVLYADGDGGVTTTGAKDENGVTASGGEYLVVDVDTADETVTFIM